MRSKKGEAEKIHITKNLGDKSSRQTPEGKDVSIDASSLMAKKTALKKLSQFVLNRATENLRNELYEFLIMAALYDTKEELTKEEIISSIQKDLGVKQLPTIIINSTLKRLIEKRDIECIQSQGRLKHFLSQTKREKLSRMTHEYGAVLSAVTDKLITLVEKKYGLLTDAEKATVIQNFQMLLGTIFSVSGFECANAIVGKPVKMAERMIPVDISESIAQILEGTKGRLSEIQKEVFMDYLYAPDENLSAHLYSLAQSYYLIGVLNLDPECQTLIKESLTKKVGYLDTNMIVFLVGGTKRSKVVEDLIKLSTDLGIKIKFTERTKEEFIKHVERKKGIYTKKGQISLNRCKKIKEKLEDGFFKDYLERRKTNPGLTYEGYFARLKEIETLLRRKYSIEFDGSSYEDIKKHEDMERVKTLVIKYFSIKTDTVAEHDAYHILLMQELRERERGDVLGSSCWFVTYDKSLYYVDGDLAREEPDRIPSSIYVDKWIQMISPLLSPDVSNKTAKEVFTNLFASRIPVLTKTVKEEDFLDLQGSWMDDEDLGPEELARIIGDHYVREHLESLREARARGEEEKISEVIGPVIIRIKKEIGQKYDAKINGLRQEYNAKIGKLEQAIKRSKFIKSLFLIGLISFILIPTLGLAAAYQKWVISDTVYWGLTILALFFIASSFFGRRVFRAIPLSK